MLPTVEALAADLAAGRTSSVELTTAALARAADPVGEGARVFTHIDAERALVLARASDALRRIGPARSPLDGLPVSMKDLFDIAGQTTCAGSVLLRDAPPAARNATVVDRLQAAGAVIVGRTNMTEFAYSGLGINPHHGTPRNAWDRIGGRIPGGSVRIPAALCGLAGYKPTARRVPMDGVLPLSAALDSVGPLAASVRCCAIVDAVLSGEPVAVPDAADLVDARLAIPDEVVLDDLDADVAGAFEAACRILTAAGARIRRISIPELAELPALHARGTFTAAEAWAWHRQHIETRASAYDPRVVSRIQLGARMTAADLIDLAAARRRWIAKVQSRISGIDALLMPTVPWVAPQIATLVQDEAAYYRANGLMLRNPTFINFLDGCALSLPCQAPGAPPVGLMLAAAGGRDAQILALGQAVEAALARGFAV